MKVLFNLEIGPIAKMKFGKGNENSLSVNKQNFTFDDKASFAGVSDDDDDDEVSFNTANMKQNSMAALDEIEPGPRGKTATEPLGDISDTNKSTNKTV